MRSFSDETVPEDVTPKWLQDNIMGETEWDIRNIDSYMGDDLQLVLATVSAAFSDGRAYIDARLSFTLNVHRMPDQVLVAKASTRLDSSLEFADGL